MELINAGGHNRTCMIYGGLAFACFCSGFVPGWGAAFIGAAAITAEANGYGCSN